MDKIELKALGKINLGLDILGKRDNGYHDVRMVMQTVYLYDRVVLEKREKPGIEIQTNLHFLPVNAQNIAYKAAKLLIDEFKITSGMHIALEKHIPVAAGMAGGSANAAAVLYGMNKLYELGLSEKALMERGVTLGADVPYCIMRGTVLAEGIGEILTPLPPMPRCFLVIAKPPVSASTKVVYEKIDAMEIKKHPNIDGILSGLQKGSIEEVAQSMGNVLELVMLEECPILKDIKQMLIEAGALNAMMSGSGPTVFGIFKERRKAKAAVCMLKEKKLAKQVYMTNVHNVRRSE